MSEYDLLRLSNLKRNENYIKSLGFDASNSEMEEENHLSTKKGIKRYATSIFNNNTDESDRRQSYRISNRSDHNKYSEYHLK